MLQPSNQLASQPAPVDVLSSLRSDRRPGLGRLRPVSDGASPIFVEITHPWPPNAANVLEPGAWRLELLVVGDNIGAARSFVTVTFDGTWADPESPAIWEHFIVDGPSPEIPQPPRMRLGPPKCTPETWHARRGRHVVGQRDAG